MTKETTTESPTFEMAFGRLEKILEAINAGQVSLDEALKLYEEADGLITSCSRRLAQAEQRVETLIKNRQGELSLGADGKPRTEPLGSRSSPMEDAS